MRGWRGSARISSSLIFNGAPAGADRSAELHKVVGALREIGWSSDRIAAVLRAHPAGIAARCFERGKDDVERQVRMSLRKIDDHIAARRSTPPPPSSATSSAARTIRRAGPAKAPRRAGRIPTRRCSMIAAASCPSFPLTVLTEPWQQWVTRAAQGAGVSIDHVVVPLLAIVAGQIGAARRVEAVPAWGERLGLVDHARRLFRHRQNARPECHETRSGGRGARSRRPPGGTAPAARNARGDGQGGLQDVGRTTLLRPSPMACLHPRCRPRRRIPGPYVEPRLFVSDATIEKLAVLVKRPSPRRPADRR